MAYCGSCHRVPHETPRHPNEETSPLVISRMTAINFAGKVYDKTSKTLPPECRDIHVIPFQGSQKNGRAPKAGARNNPFRQPGVLLRSVKTNRLAKVSQIDLGVTHATIKQATRTIRKGPIAAAPAVPPKADTSAESNEQEDGIRCQQHPTGPAKTEKQSQQHPVRMNTRSFLTQAGTQPKAAGHVSLTFTFPNLRSFPTNLSSRQETQIFATFTINDLAKNLTKNKRDNLSHQKRRHIGCQFSTATA